MKCLKISDQIITDQTQIAEQIAVHLSQVSNPTYEQSGEYNLNFSSDQREIYNSEITFSELEHAIQSLKLTSTAGPDLIHNQMLTKISQEAKNNLLTYFNNIWTGHVFPDDWRISEIIPIPKQGKPTTTPENLRPISLTSCLCKLLEKIVSKRFDWYLESNNLITKEQSGGRRKRSTLDQLLLLQDEILTTFSQSEYLFCIACDISHAYQSVKKEVVMNQLHEWGLRGNLAIFIQNYLTDRKFYVRLGNEKSTLKNIKNSIPKAEY